MVFNTALNNISVIS